jgi:hypothetical protein
MRAGGQMNCFQHHLTMPDQILLALLQADAAHLDKERRELIKLRDQVGQSVGSHVTSSSRGGKNSVSTRCNVPRGQN